jgi:hypothetical protein
LPDEIRRICDVAKISRVITALGTEHVHRRMDAPLKMSEFRLETYVPLFAHRGVANVTHWNKSRGSALISAKESI